MSQEPIKLGGRQFELKAMPWGKLRQVMAAINRVGAAAAAGIFEDSSLEDMSTVLCLGYGIDRAELDAMPTDIGEIQRAFEAVVRVSGLEQAMEKALGEARRAGRINPPELPTSTPGTLSTPT